MSEKFINEDKNLLNLDFLVVSDTRLTKKDADDDLKDRLNNWNIVSRFDTDDKKKHMGMILLQSLHSSIVSEYSMKPFFKKVEGSNPVFAQILTLKLSKMSVKVWVRNLTNLMTINRIYGQSKALIVSN